MFRLKATLVATTLMRPWRTGWSEDRGVDFSLAAEPAPMIDPLNGRADAPTAERACFIDEDQVDAGDAVGMRTYVSTAAAAADPAAGDAPEASRLRAWWSVSGKTSGA